MNKNIILGAGLIVLGLYLIKRNKTVNVAPAATSSACGNC